MAATGRIPRAPLIQDIQDRAWAYEFHQAVRLLEAYLDRGPVGRTAEPEGETIRFRSYVSLAFPASELEAVQVPSERDRPAQVTVSFLGLASALGPLPRPFTEWVLERVARKDYALRDFLDIFNHRLVAYHYRVREKHRPSLRVVPADQSQLAGPLFALAGLGSQALRNRSRVPDRAILPYAALLGRGRPIAQGLSGTLSHYFALPVKVVPFQGGWQELEPGQWTQLGRSGSSLGVDTVLGTRAWNQEARVEVQIGPMSFSEFLEFLPGNEFGEIPDGPRLAPLVDLATLQADASTQVVARLALAADEVPKLPLTSGPEAPRLGYTSWLGPRRKAEAAGDVVIPLA